MTTKAVPALGFTQFNTELPSGYAIVIRRSDGSTAVFRDHATEIVVAPILSFSDTFRLRDADIPYECEILPRAIAGMTKVSYPREVPTELKKKIAAKFQVQAERLIKKQFDNRMITIEVGHNGAEYSCFIRLTARN